MCQNIFILLKRNDFIKHQQTKRNQLKQAKSPFKNTNFILRMKAKHAETHSSFSS